MLNLVLIHYGGNHSSHVADTTRSYSRRAGQVVQEYKVLIRFYLSYFKTFFELCQVSKYSASRLWSLRAL